MTEYVKIKIENGIGTIEFFHPQSNSLPGHILAELANTITNAGADESIKVLILKSAGERAFCAGASFDELVAIDNAEDGKKFFSGFANVINAARKCPKFIIGRIQGKAVGGGVGMAVKRKVGTSAFSAMTINATKWFDANWSREKGLYTEVSDTSEEMDIEIHKLASTLSQSNPEAMQELKKVMWEGSENWDDLLMERAESSGKLVLSDFTRNAIESFKTRNE